MNFSKVLIFFVVLSLSKIIFADDSYQAPEIQVLGEEDQTSQESAGSYTKINTKDYEERVVSLAEVLQEQAGIHVTRYGGLENLTSISIRGSYSDEVLVIYDGIPLNSSIGGGIDLSPFLFDSLEEIEIYRGSSPSEYGLFPAAGVISLSSKKIKEGHHGAASFQYGSFNSLKSHAHFSTKKNKFSFLISNTFSRSSGNFYFNDNNGTPFNKLDDSRPRRINNETQTIHPFIKIAYEFDSDTMIKLTAHLIRKDSGAPGKGTNQAENTSLDETEIMTQFELDRKNFFHKNLSFNSKTFFRYSKSQFDDPDAELGVFGPQDTDNKSSFFGETINLKYFPNDHHIIRAFLFYQHERFIPQNFNSNPSGGLTNVRHQWNLGLSDEISLFENHLFIQPSLWFENIYNRFSDDDPALVRAGFFRNNKTHHNFSGKIGIKGVVNQHLSFISHFSRQFKQPSFLELFGDRGSVVGNPTLRPQESINWDIGLSVEDKSKEDWWQEVLFKSSYFERYLDDLIQFQNAISFAQAQNVGEAKVSGIETHFYFEFLNHLSTTVTYTFQRAKDRALYDGRYLVGRPKHELNTKLSFWHKSFKSFVSLNYMDKNFSDPLNTRSIDRRFMLHAGLSYKLKKNYIFAFEAKNLTNEQVEDVLGYPLPGRSFFGKIQFSK